uniref:Uncharacterized protein n=1 Tax=Pyxicephalus adspersus TaxID=30357 RepID=A0AAV3A933_PYXAD|nr:TPA: hypothetical protein GDO54_017536 [Pyxicephalus adspersus]
MGTTAMHMGITEENTVKSTRGSISTPAPVILVPAQVTVNVKESITEKATNTRKRKRNCIRRRNPKIKKKRKRKRKNVRRNTNPGMFTICIQIHLCLYSKI